MREYLDSLKETASTLSGFMQEIKDRIKDLELQQPAINDAQNSTRDKKMASFRIIETLGESLIRVSYCQGSGACPRTNRADTTDSKEVN